jgi:TatD DNase family protein
VADSHCHLDLALDGDPRPVADALRAAAEVGVTRVVQVGVDAASSRWAVTAAQQHQALVAAVALHPNEAPRLAECGDLDAAFAVVAELARDERTRAIGETGLDHFRTAPEGRGAQEESFRRHIRLAKEHRKALVVHDRDAHDDVLRVLDDEGAPQHVVMHCFSGDAAFARACVDRGLVLSFAGTVTFKNAELLREAARVVPVGQLLVETDAPYLAPVPHRGRPNASYLVPLTVGVLAQVRDEPVAALCEQLDATTTRVFGRWGYPPAHAECPIAPEG